MLVNQFLGRMPTAKYKCYDLVRDAWLINFEEDISSKLLAFKLNRHLSHNEMKHFQKLDQPISPCVVVFQRGTTPPHIGIFFEGNVLHLAGLGAEYQPFDVVAKRYPRARFYK